MEGKLRVSVVATGIDAGQQTATRPQAARPSSSPFGGVSASMGTGSVPQQTPRPIMVQQPEPQPEPVFEVAVQHEEPLALDNSMLAPQPLPSTEVNMRSEVRENVVPLPTAPLVENFERSYAAPAQPDVPESRTPLVEPVRSGSLFERLTNFGGQARAERKEQETEARKGAASGGEDPFAIPTFLRRQGN
jgi:cell division protein FtsZ